MKVETRGCRVGRKKAGKEEKHRDGINLEKIRRKTGKGKNQNKNKDKRMKPQGIERLSQHQEKD